IRRPCPPRLRRRRGKRPVKLGRVEPTSKWRLETADTVAGFRAAPSLSARHAASSGLFHFRPTPSLMGALPRLGCRRDRLADDGLGFLQDAAQAVARAEPRCPEVPNTTRCAGTAGSGTSV